MLRTKITENTLMKKLDLMLLLSEKHSEGCVGVVRMHISCEWRVVTTGRTLSSLWASCYFRTLVPFAFLLSIAGGR